MEINEEKRKLIIYSLFIGIECIWYSAKYVFMWVGYNIQGKYKFLIHFTSIVDRGIKNHVFGIVV